MPPVPSAPPARPEPLALLAETIVEHLTRRHRSPQGGTTLVRGDTGDDWRAAVRTHDAPGRRVLLLLAGDDVPGDLEAHAAGAGLALSRAVPYGVLLGGGDSVLAPLDRTHRWRRVLSWLPYDPRLLDLAVTLDGVLGAALPDATAPRRLVILDPVGTPAPDVPDDPGPADLDPLLTTSRTRYLCFAVVAQLAQRLASLEIASVLPPQRAEEYDAWQAAHAVDDQVTRILGAWSTGCARRMRHGADVTLASDYPLARQLLEQHYRVFDGGPA
ncbi:hypothetical protein [Nocardioides lianchengensis]|uniref:Uncharacterized protein n=1 Tax=Nocardioides lianchengensis TaxID=1045774 RepID=A0A1G6I351_9ACTN|nr:hypothetical protein [Nocardioides lianchengensis]NYG13199.1 hypothetical protein [Nocardioides lianchengensis]SDC00505.1 hypothetical protein SAMN05421872_10127 [Nocardioides lianchengensis]